jgi:hypothetical protein
VAAIDPFAIASPLCCKIVAIGKIVRSGLWIFPALD